jgi:hypothetical protein
MGGVMAKNVSDRIAHLKAQQEKLAKKLNTLEQKAKDDHRKRDTRRKIIIGGAVLAEMEKDDDFASSIRVLLGRYVGRQRDRETLGDLLPSSNEPPAASISQVGSAMARLLDQPDGGGSGVSGG